MPSLAPIVAAEHQADAALLGRLRDFGVDVVDAGVQTDRRQRLRPVCASAGGAGDSGSRPGSRRGSVAERCGCIARARRGRGGATVTGRPWHRIRRFTRSAATASSGALNPCTSTSRCPKAGRRSRSTPTSRCNVPDQPIIPYIEGDGTGARHHAGDAQGGRRGGRQGLRRQEARSTGWRSTPARSRPRSTAPTSGCRDETLDAVQGLRRLDQGPADDAGRRRHPLAERRAAPGTRPLRLPAPDPVLQGRAVAR